MQENITDDSTLKPQGKHISPLTQKIAFCFGNFGHASFYNVMSMYFMVYVTNSMFSGFDNQAVANKLIGLITGLVVAIRIVEIGLDPILGNVIDNTNSKWGKFKPWQLSGGIISALLVIVIFTGVFGLAKVNALLFAIIFSIVFITLDIFYSLRDISYWGMIPAISEDSRTRGTYTALGNFSGVLGGNGITIVVVPIVTIFTFWATGKRTEGAPGWLAFSIFAAGLAIASTLVLTFGTKENNTSAIRKAATEHTTLVQLFKGIAQNDQMLWNGLSYLFYSISYVATGGIMFYLFKYVLGKPGEFWISGVIPTITGFIIVPLYPILNKYIPRKWLFVGAIVSSIIGYLLFILSTDNLAAVLVALVFFYGPQPVILMTVVLTFTDAIEYGQLKNGHRNEAVTLSFRPMLDKISGAFSNGIVGAIAIAAGMTGAATAQSITAANIHTFKIFAFYTPLLLVIISLVIFLWKVKITEKKHAEIVEELQLKLAKENLNAKKMIASETSEDSNATTSTVVLAPVDGDVIPLKDVPNEINGKLGFPGTGFAVKPIDGKVYAPFDGTIEFTFSTKHVLGIISDSGLETVIHVGMGTVNMRGEGFVTHYNQGQKINKGELLLSFDRDLIRQNGYSDVVVTFFTQPQRITKITSSNVKQVKHGEEVVDITFTKK